MEKTNKNPGSSELAAKSLNNKALGLSYFTVGYNIIEGLLSIFAGVIASSIALWSFGIDSFIESLSGGIMIWRFSLSKKMSGEQIEETESKALKWILIFRFRPLCII